jgi:RimJ/RimL family protein N-acetyltransferase
MWGKGIVSEAVKAMIDYCFHHYPLVYRIFGCVLEKNVGSYKVLEKAHCVREGVERSARIIDDHFENVFYYSLLRPEWQQAQS